MNKKVILILMLIFLISLTAVEAAKVDKEILNKLNEKKVNGKFILQSDAQEEIPVIIKLKDGVTDKTRIKGDSNFKSKYDYSSFNGFAGSVSLGDVEKLIDNNNVEAVYFDRVYKISLSDVKGLVNATTVWPLVANGLNLTGKGLTACVLDTGVNYSHVNLGAMNCVSGSFSAGNCGRIIGGYDYNNNDADPYDDHGHGTHVAGIIASNASDYRGMAPESNIIMMKVCNAAGSCSTSAMLSGFDWCINNRSVYNISVISVSIGGGLYSNYCDNSSSFTSSINNATSFNISVVIAAGNGLDNDGVGRSTQISEPACVENATAVSSVDKSDTIASYSNRGVLTDLFAIGGSVNDCTNGVCSTSISGGFVGKMGTSMATPEVSGAILLLNQYKKAESNRYLTVNESLIALNRTGKTIYDSATGLNYSRILIYPALVSIDVLNPALNLSEPRNATYYINQSMSLNYSASDVMLQSIWYNIDEGTNFTLSGNATFNLSYGSHRFYIYANDTKGNLNITNVNFSVLQVLTLDIIKPENTSYNSRNIFVNLSSNGAENIWFYNGTTNITYSTAGYYNFSEGFNQLIAYSNNSQLSNSTNVNFTVDSIKPYAAFTQPLNNSVFTYNVYVNITNNSDAVNVWFFNGTGNQSYGSPVYVNLSSGSYNLMAYANDSVGNLNYSFASISVDLTAPTVSVNSPSSGSYFKSNFSVNITVVDSNVGVNSTAVYFRWENSSTNSSWYRMGNLTVSYFNFTFNISDVYDGNYTIRFNASDLFNNSVSSGTTSFVKDTAIPLLNVSGNVSASVASTSSTITFHTNESTNVTINYGTTLLLGTKSESNSFTTTHSHAISSLTASTLYYYNLTFCDQAANCNTTGTYSFTTSASGGVPGDGGGGGGGGGGGDTNNATAVVISWGSMNAGQVYELTTAKPNFVVQKISITPNRALSNVQVIVKQLKGKPNDVLKEPDNVYSYFEVSKVNLLNSDLNKAVIYFNVDKSFVDSKGRKEDLTLLRYGANDKWDELKTSFVSESSGKYNYQADTPGFSYFSIAMKQTAPESLVRSKEAEIAAVGNESLEEDVGFSVSDIGEGLEKVLESAKSNKKWIIAVILILVIIFIVAYLLYRRGRYGGMDRFQYRPKHEFFKG